MMVNKNIAIDTALSNKFKVISFFLMILIIFIHAYNLGYSKSDDSDIITLNYVVQNFISQGIARVAVPLYFFISAILYYLKFDFKFKTYVSAVKKRIKSLVIPYLSWSIIGFLFYFILEVNPLTNRYFSNNENSIVNYSFLKILKVIFVDPIPFQFWFIRDLFILILISPVIEFINKYSKGYWLLLLLIVWLFKLPIDFIVQIQSLLFFAMGGFVVRYKFFYLKKKISLRIGSILFILWILLNFIQTVFKEYFSSFIEIVHTFSILIGILSIWILYDYIYKTHKLPNHNPIVATTFFLFAFHEPLLTLVRKVLLLAIGTGDSQLLLIYFLSASITIIISIYCGLLLKKQGKPLYAVLTGGR